MAQKYDLTDIGNALSRVMDNPMTKIIRSGSIGEMIFYLNTIPSNSAIY